MSKRKRVSPVRRRAAHQSRWIGTDSFYIAALVVAASWAYWSSIHGGFHFDDQEIFLNPYIASSGFGWKILRLTQTRPLTFLSFHWNFLTGGASPWGYHAVNVALHVGNSILVYLIARRLLPAWQAWLAGALFALHPIQSQAVNYVFERATLLAAFLALLSLLLFLREMLPWSVLAFALSGLAKEETLALPAFLLLYEVIRKRRPVRWKYYAAMAGVALLVSARLLYVLRSLPEAGLAFGTKGVSAVSYALTEPRVIWSYLSMLLIPVGLNLDHDVSVSRSLFTPPSTFPAIALLALAIGLLSEGDTDAALRHLSQALQSGGDRPLIWNNIGVVQLRRGEAADAIGSFRRALESDPCRFDARWNLVSVLASSGKKEDAARAQAIPEGCHLLPEQIAKLERAGLTL